MSEVQVNAFEAQGQIVAIHTFFESIQEKPEKILFEDTSGKALVTERGIYAFLETPANASLLESIEPGANVKIKGQEVEGSYLLHVEAIEKAEAISNEVVQTWSKNEGQQIEMSGCNKCQCGLSVGDIHSNCDLGHIHHFETSDGTMYHYLQIGPHQSLKANHFCNLEMKVTLFPGNWILVQDSKEIKE